MRLRKLKPRVVSGFAQCHTEPERELELPGSEGRAPSCSNTWQRLRGAKKAFPMSVLSVGHYDY